VLKKTAYILWLMCFFLGGAVLLVFYVPFDQGEPLALDLISTQKEQEDVPVSESGSTLRSFDEFEKIFSVRNVFQPLNKDPVDQNGLFLQGEPGGDFEKNYRIVGILVNHDSKVVFQDTVQKEAVFVSVGGMIGGAVVEQIKSGSVVININGRTMEITP